MCRWDVILGLVRPESLPHGPETRPCSSLTPLAEREPLRPDGHAERLVRVVGADPAEGQELAVEIFSRFWMRTWRTAPGPDGNGHVRLRPAYGGEDAGFRTSARACSKDSPRHLLPDKLKDQEGGMAFVEWKTEGSMLRARSRRTRRCQQQLCMIRAVGSPS